MKIKDGSVYERTKGHDIIKIHFHFGFLCLSKLIGLIETATAIPHVNLHQSHDTNDGICDNNNNK